MSQLDFFDILMPNNLIPENLDKRECYVYVMEDIQAKQPIHKIGLSNNPRRRLKEIYKHGNPVKLVEVMVFDNRKIANRVELLAHAIASWQFFRDYRYGDGGTEFFKITKYEAIKLIRKAYDIFESFNRDLETFIAYTKEVRSGKITVAI